MRTADQTEVCNYLFHLLEERQTEMIETHISVVFLSADRVFKLKKAVKLPYLDFSDAAQRLYYCRRELELNRRTAPAIYRGVHTIVRKPDGTLAMDADGELVDAVVEMARFDQALLFDAIARAGRLDDALADALALHIARFHMQAEIVSGKSGEHVLRHAQEANSKGFAETRFSGHADIARLLERTEAAIAAAVPVLNARAQEGKVRRCHGDLHLRNICLFDGKPVLFDCLEFDEELASTDILYDLAFLLMDLLHVGLPQLANRIYNRYLDTTRDAASLAVMPLFISMRSSVRAHVSAARAAGASAQEAVREAQDYVDLALRALDTRLPRLVAIGGLSGSGKSSAAAAVAPAAGSLPGARILSTDRIRKSLSGVGPLERLPQQAYSATMSQKVYAEQCKQALEALRGGSTVVADGVFLRADERQAIADVARQAGVAFSGFWLEAPLERLVARVGARRGDPSDATAEVVRLQAQHNAGPRDWTRVDASMELGKVVEEILGSLDRAGSGDA